MADTPRDVRELNDLLDQLEWTSAELARRVEVHRNTVARWRSEEVPRVVILYLRLMVKARETSECAGL